MRLKLQVHLTQPSKCMLFCWVFYSLSPSMPFGDADVEERKARMRGGEVYEFKPDQKGE